jgi:single-strand DNA-binding protein
MLNRIVLIGRLTRDPELRYTPSGVAVCTFTLAVDRPYTNQDGERGTDFINIVTWRGLAETCARYLKKGRLTGLEGRLQIRNYETTDGRRVYVAEVVADLVRFLEAKEKSAVATANESNFEPPFDDDPFADDGVPIDIAEEDLPF